MIAQGANAELVTNAAARTDTPEHPANKQQRNSVFGSGLEDRPDQERSARNDHRPA